MSFIDIECYCWSTVLAEFTPMINAGMVFCDRHYGGINYPKVSQQLTSQLRVFSRPCRGVTQQCQLNRTHPPPFSHTV